MLEVSNLLTPPRDFLGSLNAVDVGLKKANDAIKNGDLQDALSLGLKEWRERLASVVRASDFVAGVAIAKGNLIMAAEIADYIKTSAPRYPQGYLRTSQVQHIQGNLIEALAECKAGRKGTNAIYHPVFETAERKIRPKSINFVDRLPMEIVDEVFGYLDPDFLLVRCMSVSKSWREHLSQRSVLWRAIEIGNQRGFSREGKAAQSLSLVARHVQQLKITNADTMCLVHFCDAVAKHAFVNLKSLSIQGEKYKGTATFRLRTSLLHLPLSLTTLKVDSIGDPHLTLRKILIDLPNLTILNYYNACNQSEHFDEPLPASPALKILNLSTTCNLKSESVEHILQALPHLVGFGISESDENGLLLTTRHCKHLKHLSFNAGMDCSSFLDDALKADSPSLSKLVVGTTDVAILQDFLRCHDKTLEEIRIYNHDRNTIRAQSANLFRAWFEKLRILHFYGRVITQSEIAFTESIVSGCTDTLEELRLDYQNCDMTSIFRRVSAFPNLKSLIVSAGAMGSGFEEYAKSMELASNKCPLRAISLEECSITRQQLDWITIIPTIERVAIIYPKSVKAYDLRYLFKSLQFSSVKSVILESKKTIRKVTLDAIGKMESLEEVDIRGDLGVAEHELVKSFIKTIAQKLPTVRVRVT